MNVFSRAASNIEVQGMQCYQIIIIVSRIKNQTESRLVCQFRLVQLLSLNFNLNLFSNLSLQHPKHQRLLNKQTVLVNSLVGKLYTT